MLVGILQGKTLMAEQTYLVVHELQTGSVQTLQEIERKVCRRIHCLRIVLETHKVHGIGCRDVQLRLFAHSRRIERRLHVEIMAERHVILRARSQGGKRKEDECYYFAFKHVLITSLSLFYCQPA